MKMLLIVFLSFSLVLGVWANEEVMSYKTFGKYLYESSNEVIKSMMPSDLDLKFKISNKRKTATAILPDPDIDFVHSLFETDVRKMIQNYGAVDFISAKKKFYNDQDFSSRTLQYSRPYVYSSDWRNLAHPPIRHLIHPYEVYGKQFANLDSRVLADSIFYTTDFHQKLDDLTGTEMTSENDVTLLSNGENSYREKMRMIRTAKKFFFSVVMVEYCDQTGSQYAEALFERVRAGVDVRLIVESVWSKLLLQQCLTKLETGGVKVLLSNGFFNLPTMFTVMHDKFWIRDGEEAIIGGQNMHDFENLSNGFNGHTRDRDVLIHSGPAVTDLLKEYIELWNYFYNKEDLSLRPYLSMVETLKTNEREQGKRGRAFYKKWLSDPVQKSKGLCRAIVQGSQNSRDLISKAYLEIIKNVQYSILIDTLNLRYKENANIEHYNTLIANAIIERSAKGVKTDIISNGIDGEMGDTGFYLRRLAEKLRKKKKFELEKIVIQLLRSMSIRKAKPNHKALFKLAQNPNIDAWEYFNHIHSKQIVFDQILTSTGSFNLDQYSYRNHEATLICLDKKLADDSVEGFVSDIVNSVPVNSD